MDRKLEPNNLKGHKLDSEEPRVEFSQSSGLLRFGRKLTGVSGYAEAILQTLKTTMMLLSERV